MTTSKVLVTEILSCKPESFPKENSGNHPILNYVMSFWRTGKNQIPGSVAPETLADVPTPLYYIPYFTRNDFQLFEELGLERSHIGPRNSNQDILPYAINTF